MNIPGVNTSSAKLTNVDAQRIMAVLDDAVAKFATNATITERFSTSSTVFLLPSSPIL